MPVTIDVTAREGDSPLLTAREAAAFLRISERMLWNLTKQGKIKATRIGSRVLYTLACLQLFVDESTFREGDE